MANGQHSTEDYRNRYVTNGELMDKLEKVPEKNEMRAYVAVGAVTNLGIVVSLLFAIRPSVVQSAFNAVLAFFS